MLDEVDLEAEGGPVLGVDVGNDLNSDSEEEDSDEEFERMKKEKKRRERGFIKRILHK